jgi:hypothetical protein
MTDCCMDIEINATSKIAETLLKDGLHNYSEIANLASLLEGGGPYMVRVSCLFVVSLFVCFAFFSTPIFKRSCGKISERVYFVKQLLRLVQQIH